MSTTQHAQPGSKNWLPWAIALSIVLVVDAGWLLIGLLTPTLGLKWNLLTSSTGPAMHALAPLGIAHVIVWTVGLPAYFFFETFVIMRNVLPDPTRNGGVQSPEDKAKFERWKLQHDMAKAFWAAVLASILFCIPKS